MNFDPIFIPVILITIFALYKIVKRKKKKKHKPNLTGYKFTGGTKAQQDQFEAGMLYIKNRNANLYKRIDMSLSVVIFNQGNFPDAPTSLMSAPVKGNKINVWKPMYTYTSVKYWAAVIIHEAMHLEGHHDGPELEKIAKQLRKTVGIDY